MKNSQTDFLQWIEKCAAELNEAGRFGQCINYRKAEHSFTRFLEDTGTRSPSLKDISHALIVGYNGWLERNGKVPNSVSFYNRQLRAIYNRAVKEGLTKDHRPFDDVYTGVARTSKRAIPLNDIREICSVIGRDTAVARDMFAFSFQACGMTFADMVYLRKADISGGVISYRRRKTGTYISVPLTPHAENIVRKYSTMTEGSAYVFPILGDETGERAYKKYLSALTVYNRSLKKIGRQAHTPGSLTSYVTRHSWATAARDTGAPVAVISTALGHSSEKTTQIYLDSMDPSRIAAVNRQIMSEIAPKKEVRFFPRTEFTRQM